MPRNVYFSQAVRSEQHLYEDLVIESLKIFAQDVYYIPRTIVTRDTILGEDPASKFDDAYLIEAYIENPEGFDGEGDLYSKFGLEIRDEASFIISRKIWNNSIGINENLIKPAEGDLLYLPLSNSFFEISFVEDDKPFYQLSNLPVYKLSCALFEYNDQEMDTGIAAIDKVETEYGYQFGIDVTVTGGNHFTQGEIVTQYVGNTFEKLLAFSMGIGYQNQDTINLKAGQTTAGIEVGMIVSHVGMVANTKVVSIDSNNNRFVVSPAILATIGQPGTDYEDETLTFKEDITVFGEVQTVTKTSDTAATISVSNIGTRDTTNAATATDKAREFIVSTTPAVNNLVGSESGNTCVITNVYTLADDDTNNTFASDSQAKNVQFEIEGDNFIDFSESNPFGDPSETL